MGCGKMQTASRVAAEKRGTTPVALSVRCKKHGDSENVLIPIDRNPDRTVRDASTPRGDSDGRVRCLVNDSVAGPVAMATPDPAAAA